MANNFDKIIELASANNMGLSNTIKRDFGIPLDYTSVQESYEAAVIYAATNTLAYVGQTVAVGGTLYIINETANGTYTVGTGDDAKTYDNYLTEVGSKTEGDGNTIVLDGQTLKLAGLTDLANNKTYVPSLVNGKLVWSEPDTSTADGQAAAIAALETRASNLETTINGKPADGSSEAVKGLVEKLADEVTAREEAIGTPAAGDVAASGIYAEIATALQAAKDYADAQDADTIYDDTALSNRVSDVEADLADHATRIAGIELFFEDAAKDEGEGENLQNALDTLVEIQNYINSDGTAATQMAEDINANKAAIEKLNGDAETTGSVAKTVADAISVQVEAINADIAEVEAKADAAATQVYVTEELAKKADKDSVYTKSEIDTKIGTPGTPEIPAQGTEGEEDYVPKQEAVYGTGIFASTYSKAEINSLLDKVSGGSSETAASVKNQLDTYKSENNNRVTLIENKNTEQDASIAAVLAKADQGIKDAATAKQTADAAQSAITALTNGQVNTNKNDIATLTTLVTGADDNSHATRIGKLEAFNTQHQNDFSTLNGKVNENSAAIATKADADNVYEKTTIDDLLATKADAALTYTKDDVDAKVITSGEVIHSDSDSVTIANNKITVAINSYTKDDVDDLVGQLEAADADISATLNTLIGDDTGKSARDIATEELNALIQAADPENDIVIQNITNLVKYVDDNASDIAELVTTVNDNTDAINNISASIAAIVTPKASTEITVATDGTLGIGEISTDKLVQGTNILVLNGGTSAGV